MKRLFKIGVLLLFMVGMFTVQTGFSTPVLVDDDVGVEFIDNTDVSDNAVLAITLEIQVPVITPLKYLLSDTKCVILFIGNTNQEICFEALQRPILVIQGESYIPEKMLTNLTEQTKDKLSKQTVMIMGLFRLDIGESS